MKYRRPAQHSIPKIDFKFKELNSSNQRLGHLGIMHNEELREHLILAKLIQNQSILFFEKENELKCGCVKHVRDNQIVKMNFENQKTHNQITEQSQSFNSISSPSIFLVSKWYNYKPVKILSGPSKGTPFKALYTKHHKDAWETILYT